MAVILVGVFGLRLRAQHHLVDQRLGGFALHARKHAVEMRRAHPFALGELDAEGGEKLAELADFLRARRVVGAVDQRRMRGLQRLGRRDIGEDHEFLDQFVRLQPLRPAYADELAVGVEDQLALRQVEIERITLRALDLDDVMSGVERLQHALEQRRRRLVGWPSIARCACS